MLYFCFMCICIIFYFIFNGKLFNEEEILIWEYRELHQTFFMRLKLRGKRMWQDIFIFLFVSYLKQHTPIMMAQVVRIKDHINLLINNLLMMRIVVNCRSALTHLWQCHRIKRGLWLVASSLLQLGDTTWPAPERGLRGRGDQMRYQTLQYAKAESFSW